MGDALWSACAKARRKGKASLCLCPAKRQHSVAVNGVFRNGLECQLQTGKEWSGLVWVLLWRFAGKVRIAAVVAACWGQLGLGALQGWAPVGCTLGIAACTLNSKSGTSDDRGIDGIPYFWRANLLQWQGNKCSVEFHQLFFQRAALQCKCNVFILQSGLSNPNYLRLFSEMFWALCQSTKQFIYWNVLKTSFRWCSGNWNLFVKGPRNRWGWRLKRKK